MSLEQRSQKRKNRMSVHRAKTFADAEDWDLNYWQKQPPEVRLSALVAIRQDVQKAERARKRVDARRKKKH